MLIFNYALEKILFVIIINPERNTQYDIRSTKKMIAKKIIFKGTVQGVGFRFTANSTARRYGIAGWVRNLPNGTVEMFAQGPAEDIDNCIRDIEESFSGYIEDTEISEQSPKPEYNDFKITF